MRKLIVFVVLVIVFIIFIENDLMAQDSLYYYFRGEQTFLKIDTSKLLIKFDSYEAAEGYEIIRDSVSYLNYDSTLAERLENFGIFEVEPPKGYASIMNDLNHTRWLSS